MTHQKPETISTRRLCLRAIADSDFDNMASLLTNAQVAKTYMLPDFPSREAVRRLHDRLAQLSQDRSRFVYGICLEDSLIGLMNDVEIADGSIELGFALHPDYHNRGFASEALAAAMDTLFAMGFAVVKTGVFPHNAPSIRVMEKCGMTRLAETEEVEYRGRVYPCVLFEKRC